MDKRIIYPTLEGGVAVILPVEGAINSATGEPFTVAEIAAKDVPAGTPFLIIDAADVPQDRTYRAVWSADFSVPHGVGMGADSWFAANPPPPDPEPAAPAEGPEGAEP